MKNNLRLISFKEYSEICLKKMADGRRCCDLEAEDGKSPFCNEDECPSFQMLAACPDCESCLHSEKLPILEEIKRLKDMVRECSRQPHALDSIGDKLLELGKNLHAQSKALRNRAETSGLQPIADKLTEEDIGKIFKLEGAR